MTFKEETFLEAKAWAQEKLSLDREYFVKLASMHTPEILWIGSSDHLVPVEELTNTEPGELLVCRNICSQVRPDDIGMMALLEDAVLNARVQHIVVCGYSHCSGIRQIIQEAELGAHLGHWLENVKTLYESRRDQLIGLPLEQRERCLAELNIELQVQNLAQLPCIREAWQRRDSPRLHGWYFDLMTGNLRDICSMDRDARLKKAPLVQRIPA